MIVLLCTITSSEDLFILDDLMYHTMSYVMFGTYTHTFAHQLGLEEFHGVAIIGFNSPEWIIANLGAILAG